MRYGKSEKRRNYRIPRRLALVIPEEVMHHQDPLLLGQEGRQIVSGFNAKICGMTPAKLARIVDRLTVRIARVQGRAGREAQLHMRTLKRECALVVYHGIMAE